MKRTYLIPIFLLVLTLLFPEQAAGNAREELNRTCDSLTVWMQQRSGVKSVISIKSITKRGNVMDLYFTKTFSDYPWNREDLKWVREILSEAVPSDFSLGEMFCQGVNVKDYLKIYTKKDKRDGTPIVRQEGSRNFDKGLSGRYIALWQSHGRYYDNGDGLWKWQRTPFHRTFEDIFTQSYVLPFLIPMLENAGAYVMTPRERDTQINEVIIDNDPSFDEGRGPLVRNTGNYSEKGRWSDAGIGFADRKAAYSREDNPFNMGSARKVACVKGKATASATWSFSVPERGRYAVYISYRSIPRSTSGAHYTVNHLGGSTEFRIDQTRGGGTWMYLGTFEFSGEGTVVADNSGVQNTFLTADAVRIGGGMGKIDRGHGISGLPSYLEGSMYNMQWSGIDSKIWNHFDRDYTNDFGTRGAWVKSMRDDMKIPFDLTLALHSDAGVTPNDSIVGTLAIYTLKCEGMRKMSDGLDRMACRRFAQTVQDEVVNDIRADFNPDWTRRELWDRSYSESRTSDTPAVLLELLSHQNLADMKYGHDPAFKFTVCRAVYKGMLKYLSELYGCRYVVQPLPVKNFSVDFCGENKARLCWEDTEDPKEKTAVPDGYTVYTRIDDGAFDSGLDVKGRTVDMPISEGHIYSYKVVAWNDGGRSFPSEILCIGRPAVATGGNVLIVNNFTRVSAPSWIDSQEIAGFDGREDNGVPYMEDISFAGQVYDFWRNHEWISDNEPGFGATYMNYTELKVAGNNFDYPFLHGRVLMDMGLPFCSSSAGSFIKRYGEDENECGIIDLICGKQEDVFPDGLKATISRCTTAGRSFLISGANIATSFRSGDSSFSRSILGYGWVSSHGSPDGRITTMNSNPEERETYTILREPNPIRYCVENPDALSPRSSESCRIALRYSRTMTPAAIYYSAGNYRVASYGFPLECVDSDSDFAKLLKEAITFLKQ